MIPQAKGVALFVNIVSCIIPFFQFLSMFPIHGVLVEFVVSLSLLIALPISHSFNLGDFPYSSGKQIYA